MDKFTLIPGNTKPYKNQTCQQCNGTGKIFLRPNSRVPFIDCDMCEGSGKYESNLLWFVQGRMIHDWRIKKEMSLRVCADKFSIDYSNLSKMERGIIKPDSNILIVVCGEEKV